MGDKKKKLFQFFFFNVEGRIGVAIPTVLACPGETTPNEDAQRSTRTAISALTIHIAASDNGDKRSIQKRGEGVMTLLLQLYIMYKSLFFSMLSRLAITIGSTLELF